MATFAYVHPDGSVIEREGRIGHAPKFIVVNGVRCERGVEMPARVAMDAFKRGEKPSTSRQFPSYYGFRDRDACYKSWLEQRGVDYSEDRKKACVRLGIGPTPAQQNEYARRRAAAAGALGEFDGKGRAKASTKRGEFQHIARGREMGDQIALDRA